MGLYDTPWSLRVPGGIQALIAHVPIDPNGSQIGTFTPVHIAANGTTTIKNSAGTLGAVVINSKGASSNILTLLDGGTTLAIIDTTSALGTIPYMCDFLTNLTAVLGTGSAADITVVFR